MRPPFSNCGNPDRVLKPSDLSAIVCLVVYASFEFQQSTTEFQGELEDATNRGHNALSRYRKHGGKWDLEHSITEFEQAFNICPLDHPCRAATQSNLAMAKFILCQVEDTDAFLAPLGLYHSALAARPVGHVDRPSRLIQLAAVHFAPLEKGRDEVEGAQAEGLLHEVMVLGSTESHERQAVTFVLQLHAGRALDPAQADGQSSIKQGSPSRLADEPVDFKYPIIASL